MGFNFGGVGKTNVNISGGVNLASQSANVAFASAQRDVSAGTSTLYTVPGGKQARIIGVSLSWSSRTNGGDEAYQLKLNGNPILIGNDSSVGTAAAMGAGISMTFLYSACPILAAGQVVGLTSPATGHCGATVVYVEEAAGT